MSKIEQNGKTSLRRPKLLTNEVRCLMKKKKVEHAYRCWKGTVTLRCVIPVVCVTNEREGSVVNQHN